jgi:hypothetical protein
LIVAEGGILREQLQIGNRKNTPALCETKV